MLLSSSKTAPSLQHFAYSLLLTALMAAGIGAFPASAQKPDSAEVDTARTQVSAEYKSPGRALAYSLGGTVLLAPAFGAGLLIGPSFGHFYAENGKKAMSGILIRGGGVAVGGIGLGMAWENPDSGGALVLVGAGIILSSAIYDIATANRSARQYNEAHGLTAQITPTVGPSGEQVGLTRVRLMPRPEGLSFTPGLLLYPLLLE